MGAVLSEQGVRKLREVVRKVDAIKTDRTGRPMGSALAEESIWGYITGCDLSGRRYSFVRVVPNVSADDADIILDGGILKYTIVEGDGDHWRAAYEVNGARGIAAGRVVRLTFAGYREEDGEQVACWSFQYEQTQDVGGMKIHDHRDNISGGGFAFAVFHPGTGLPQQPWYLGTGT